eukprot:PhM_4_TR5300/c0_g2_i7/m.25067
MWMGDRGYSGVAPSSIFASTAAPFASSSCAIVVWPTRCAIPSCQNSPSRPPRRPSQAAAAPLWCGRRDVQSRPAKTLLRVHRGTLLKQQLRHCGVADAMCNPVLPKLSFASTA